MEAARQDGVVVVEFGLDEGNQLANAIITHAEDMSSAALELASLLRQARYSARDDFRQPPDPWSPGSAAPSI